MALTDEPWDVLKPRIPVPPRRSDGRGRPWRDARAVRHGLLWLLPTGTPWQDLPPRAPPDPTCHRRFQPWGRSGVRARLLRALATALAERGGIALSECVLAGTLGVAKQGGTAWDRPRGAKGRRAWQGQTVLVCLAPPPWRVLLRRRAPVWSQRSPRGWSRRAPSL